eukprot:TRINITY_DN5778_c0_g1_i1.p1 TRINITY_DN5778_c0_g1~~TRINITY_DN5778_c0_g1_i1.p1  ORF type:complete len:618 (-),score=107.39 TRINITY_DN5778_c0_g1_i1:53-1906(-)
MTWSRPSASGVFPSPRCVHTAALVGAKLFLFGGYDGTFLGDLYIFHIDSMTWSRAVTTGTSPTLRAGHSASVVGTLIFIFAGGDDAHYLNDIFVFDTSRMEWSCPEVTGNSPATRSRHSATVYNNEIYIFGGGDQGRVYNDLHVFDTLTNSWRKPVTSGAIPSARWGHSATLVNQHIYVFGGHDGSSMLNDLYRYDITNASWTHCSVPNAPLPRAGHTTCYLLNHLVVFAGGGERVMNDLYVLNFSRMEWIVCPTLKGGEGATPQARCAHTATVIDERRMLVFGGGEGTARRFRDLYILDVAKLLSRLEDKSIPKTPKKPVSDSLPQSQGPKHTRDNDVLAWLTELNLAKYAPNFSKEEIGMDVLPQLTEHMLLENLGIQTVGARLKILKSIKEMDGGKSQSKPHSNNPSSGYLSTSSSPPLRTTSPLSLSTGFSIPSLFIDPHQPLVFDKVQVSDLKRTVDSLVSITTHLTTLISSINIYNSPTHSPIPTEPPTNTTITNTNGNLSLRLSGGPHTSIHNTHNNSNSNSPHLINSHSNSNKLNNDKNSLNFDSNSPHMNNSNNSNGNSTHNNNTNTHSGAPNWPTFPTGESWYDEVEAEEREKKAQTQALTQKTQKS